jgi:glycosyltransferase involved in cell wall biosynthesis
MKKTVLYIIDNLSGIGGAELMMVAPLKEIHDHYNIILVTLVPNNFFEKNHFVGDKQYCLNMKSKKDIFRSVKKLKKIINENHVTFVHSFLYWSVIVARAACGKKIPHVFSLATMMTEHIYKHKWYSGYTQLLDRITYNKNQVVISPTREVLMDFDKSIGIKGKSKVLYNFVREDFFKNQIKYKPYDKEIKLVAVGNIKAVKNYQVIIDALQTLHPLPVSLDIYGLGDLEESQKKQIAENNLAIKLKGSHDKIYEVLPKYDVFVMSSFLEGFGISAAEAMATGLPLLLSDINSLKEVTKGNAIFFNPYNAQSLANKLSSIFDNKTELKDFSEKGKIIAEENFKKEKYVTGLLNLYAEIFEND